MQEGKMNNNRKDGDSNNEQAASETLTLEDWMLHMRNKTVIIARQEQHNQKRREEQRLQIIRSVHLSLEIARSMAARTFADSSNSPRKNEERQERKSSEKCLVLDIDDILVHSFDRNDAFGDKIEIVADRERTGNTFLKGEDNEEWDTALQERKLFTLSHILQQLFQSAAPFPTLGIVHGHNDMNDSNADPPNESSSFSFPQDNNHYLNPPSKRQPPTKSGLHSVSNGSLKESGIPSVLCELVTNLSLSRTNICKKEKCIADTEMKEGEEKRHSHAHSCYNPYTSMEEVIEDLQFIINDPSKFLFEYAHDESDNSSAADGATIPKTQKSEGKLMLEHGKMYGRESQISQLLSAYDRNLGQATGKVGGSPRHREIVLLAGYSGSGKSSLISQTIHERGFYEIRGTTNSSQSDDSIDENNTDHGNVNIIRNNQKAADNEISTCLLWGKFDERMNQAQPLSAIVSALDGYCIALLKNKISGLNDVRTMLRDALGSDCKALTELIPNLSGVIYPRDDQETIGQRQSTSSLTTSSITNNNRDGKGNTETVKLHGQEAKNRLKFLFCKFVRAISRPAHPIILFIDDLHWADAESLEFIYSLIGKEQQEARIPNFLFLGCYRDNQVSEGHILKECLQRIEKDGVVITNISVGNMATESVNEMLSDSLQLLPRLTMPLASIIHSKTNGNALFVKQFTSSLVESGLLKYSLSVRRWTWDSYSIRCEYVADNVAELMIDKMRRLEQNIQLALMVAACLGAWCNTSILQKLNIYQHITKEQNLSDLLDKAVILGLMTKVGSSSYRFDHDMIQFAAYCLNRNSEQMHLEIGRQLLEKCSKTELDKYIFVIATQMNEGSKLVTHHDEKIKLAALNFKAGTECMEKTAFTRAMLYLYNGTKMIGDEDWEMHYSLSLRLNNAFAEVLCLCGRWVDLKIVLDKLFRNARSFEDKLPASFTLIKSLGLQQKTSQAIEVSFEILSSLGEDFPNEIDMDVVREELINTQDDLESYSIPGIIAADEMKDTKKIAALQILNVLSLYVYMGSRQDLHPLIIFRMVRISLMHGVCKESAFGFASFGIILIVLKEDFELAYKFGGVAMSLLKRFNATEYAARVQFIVNGMVNVWKEPIQACVESINSAYYVGISTGEAVFLSPIATLSCCYSLQCGLPLDPLIKQMRSFVLNFKESKHEFNIPFMLSYLQTALNLKECTGDPTELTGEAMDQNTVLAEVVESENFNVVAIMNFLRMWMSYLFGRYDLAVEILERGRSVARGRTRNGVIVNETFYSGLLFLEKARETRQPKWRKEAQKSIKKLKCWTEFCPWNCEHKLELLQAELLFLDQKFDLAKKAYDESIDTAREHRFLHEEALACERAGIFHSVLGNRITAEDYFSKSHQLYLSWGATYKAEDVLSRYLM